MFRCSEGKCIPSLWVCNYQKDCEKGEDEFQSCRKSLIFISFCIPIANHLPNWKNNASKYKSQGEKCVKWTGKRKKWLTEIYFLLQYQTIGRVKSLESGHGKIMHYPKTKFVLRSQRVRNSILFLHLVFNIFFSIKTIFSENPIEKK